MGGCSATSLCSCAAVDSVARVVAPLAARPSALQTASACDGKFLYCSHSHHRLMISKSPPNGARPPDRQCARWMGCALPRNLHQFDIAARAYCPGLLSTNQRAQPSRTRARAPRGTTPSNALP